MSDRQKVRYGVFLTPDPRTSAAVTAVTTFVRAQYGLVSASNFPPHVTLAGSLPLNGSEENLISALTDALQGHPSFLVQNHGITLLGDAVVYDVHSLNGLPNSQMANLVQSINAVLRPRLRPSRGVPANMPEIELWRGHISLATHELYGEPELGSEVEHFIRQLPVPYPTEFQATRVSIYRLQHPTWSGSWWSTFRWERIHTLQLAM